MAFKKHSWGKKILAAITTGDSDGIEEAIREGAGEEQDPTVVVDEGQNDPMAQCMSAIGALSDKLDALPAAIAAALKGTTDEDKDDKDDKPKTEDEDKDDKDDKSKTDDESNDDEARDCTMDESAMLAEDGKVLTGDAAFSQVRKHTLSVAETLSPGLRHGTFDSASAPKVHRQSLNGIRRLALENALKDPVKAPLVQPLIGRRGVRVLTSDALFRTFVAAGKAVAAHNNRPGAGQSMTFTQDGQGISSIKSMQERNKAFWSNK